MAVAELATLRDRLGDVLRRRETRYLDLLRRMVAINTFTDNPQGVEELGRLTARAFESLGFRAETVPAADRRYGPHLVLTREAPDPAAPRIGLVSHLDTVFSAEEERRHDFRWREDGDRIYGPGTVDIKGGTVVAYMMLDALCEAASEVLDAATWVVLLDSAEEQMAPDFGPLCLERLGTDHSVPGQTAACLVFEGGLMDADEAKAVVARKGMAVFLVETHGRASHAGAGHPRGANALLQMADVIRRIEGWTDYDHDLTFNVGVVYGGTVTNRVPHSAIAQVEMRTFRSDVYDDAMAKMKSLADFSTVRSALDDYPCSVTVEVVFECDPWPLNDDTDRLLKCWQEAGDELGIDVLAEDRGGLSDGNRLWRHFPTLDGLGPSGANAHCSEQSEDGSKEQEYATRSTFVPKALLNALAVARLLEQR
ncbi:MAG: M20 family metallopeptidase [bacterium]|nr:M20 family metallopeptidase [bacterium]